MLKAQRNSLQTFFDYAAKEAERLADVLDPKRTRQGYLVSRLDGISRLARDGQLTLKSAEGACGERNAK